MTEGTRLFNQSTVMLRDCLRLERGEELLILRDCTVSRGLVEAGEYATLALGAKPLLMRYDPPVHRPALEYGLFAASSLTPTPPKSVLGAMVAADRVLFATSEAVPPYDLGPVAGVGATPAANQGNSGVEDDPTY